MVIGERLKALREQKDLSQGEIEKRTGLLRCYISRVENGHTVPSVDTMEKMARALGSPDVPAFHGRVKDVKKPNIPAAAIRGRVVHPKEARELRAFAKCLSRMGHEDRGLLIHMASKMAKRANRA